MVTIADSTLRNNIYESVYDLISNGKSSFGSPAIYGGYPDNKTIAFPNVVIFPIKVDESEYTVDNTRNSTTKNIIVQIDIYSEKNKDLDIISDGITYLLRSNSITGIMLMNVTEDFGIVFPEKSKLKQKSLFFNFVRR